jgi:predicted anti-sigma-YlaC factor YlaD
MNCKEVNKNLLSFLDGELNEAKNRSIQLHISNCKNCQEAFHQIKSLYSTIDIEKEQFEINPYLAEKVWTRLHSTGSSINTPIIPLRRLTIVSIAAAGIFLGIAIGSLFNMAFTNQTTEATEQEWSQLADDYFPNEIYTPYEELDNNN